MISIGDALLALDVLERLDHLGIHRRALLLPSPHPTRTPSAPGRPPCRGSVPRCRRRAPGRALRRRPRAARRGPGDRRTFTETVEPTAPRKWSGRRSGRSRPGLLTSSAYAPLSTCATGSPSSAGEICLGGPPDGVEVDATLAVDEDADDLGPARARRPRRRRGRARARPQPARPRRQWRPRRSCAHLFCSDLIEAKKKRGLAPTFSPDRWVVLRQSNRASIPKE